MQHSYKSLFSVKAARFFFVANQVSISCSLFLVIDRSQIHSFGSEDLGKMNH